MLDVYNMHPYAPSLSLPKLRHGRFTSPPLIDRWDCIHVNGEPVSGEIFRAVEREVLQRDRDQQIRASEFEVLTATAFEIFNREEIDVGVVEVGMGGAEDATNIIGQPALDDHGIDGGGEIIRQPPLVTVISKIGLDHQAFLGNTLEEIARQKAGILKPHVPVIFDPSNAPEVQEVILAEAAQRQSPIYHDEPSPNFVARNVSEIEELYSWSFALRRVKQAFKEANQKHVAQHVHTNAALAMMAVNTALHRLGHLGLLARFEDNPGRKKALLTKLRHLDNRMLKIIPRTVFPGRQQRIEITSLTGRKNHILLDGAHNADSANALAETRYKTKGRPTTWVLAASDSKDAAAIFAPLVQPEDSFVLVEFGPVDGMPWVKPMPVDKLEQALISALTFGTGVYPLGRHVKIVRAGNDVLYALRQATKLAQTEDGEGSLAIAGSLYLAGDVLRLVRDSEKELNAIENETASG